MADVFEDLDIAAEDDEEAGYVEYSLTSYPSDFTLAVLHDQWQAGDIVIPDYQRGYVWSLDQASKLIESFLLGLPIPQVFLYVADDAKLLVIDGQQRITSIVYFLDGFFGEEQGGSKRVFRLKGLSKRSPFEGKSFAELDAATQRKLRNAPLRAINIKQLKPESESSSVYQIFERLNTGGTPLKSQEIRNAVYRGAFNDELKSLNRDPNWRALLGKSTLDKHMRDVELLLRVFALTHFRDSYDGLMKEFLNRVMSMNRTGKTKEAERFLLDFAEIAQQLRDRLPANPFRRGGGPINSAMLEAVFCAALTHKGQLPTAPFAEKYPALLNDNAFSDAITSSTNSTVRVKSRFDRAVAVLFGK